MDNLFTAYSTAKGRAMRGDFVDKLHSRVTVTILLVILIVLVTKQYNGEAINCWLPTQFSDEQVNHKFLISFKKKTNKLINLLFLLILLRNQILI